MALAWALPCFTTHPGRPLSPPHPPNQPTNQPPTHAQAFGFYDTVIKSIDAVLALASPSDLAAADKIVGTRLKELKVEAPFLFKQFAGDFYRPATP